VCIATYHIVEHAVLPCNVSNVTLRLVGLSVCVYLWVIAVSVQVLSAVEVE